MDIKYKVDGMLLKEEGSHGKIARGSHNVIVLSFAFDESWSGMRKAVVMRDTERTQYNALIPSNGKVLIPDEVTGTSRIFVQVVGRKGDMITKTNVAVIEQI